MARLPELLEQLARAHLRRKLLAARVAVSGANFGVAETGVEDGVDREPRRAAQR